MAGRAAAGRAAAGRAAAGRAAYGRVGQRPEGNFYNIIALSIVTRNTFHL